MASQRQRANRPMWARGLQAPDEVMRFQVSHVSRYRYSEAVFLEPHSLRLRPRNDGSQHLKDFRIRVHPRPSGWSECIDLYGNAVARVWFEELTAAVTVISSFTIDTSRTNPYEFLLEPRATGMPIRLNRQEQIAMAPYLERQQPDSSIDVFGRRLLDRVGGVSVVFLTELTQAIAGSCRAVKQADGELQPPAVTLRQRAGKCRDLAVLFVDACRAIGLPARFVSGYQAGALQTDRRALHSWGEVYLPGAGWRGFDPTRGLACADWHVALAVAPEPAQAAPIDGTFRGTDVTASLDVELDIQGVKAGS